MRASRGIGGKTLWRQLAAIAIILCSVLLGVGLARTQLQDLQVPLPQQQQQAAESANPAAQQLQTRTMKARERCVQPDMDSEVHIVYASCGGGRCACAQGPTRCLHVQHLTGDDEATHAVLLRRQRGRGLHAMLVQRVHGRGQTGCTHDAQLGVCLGSDMFHVIARRHSASSTCYCTLRMDSLRLDCDKAAACRISNKMDDLLVSLYSVYIHAHTLGVTYCLHIITDGSVEESHLAWMQKR